MKLTINLTVEDWKKYQTYTEKTLPKKHPAPNSDFWKNIFTWVLVIAILIVLLDVKEFYFHTPTALLVGAFFVIFIILTIINVQKMKKAFEPNPNGVFCGRHTFTFDDEGIHSIGNGYSGFHSWEVVKNIERTEGVIMIFMDTVLAYLFPENQLEDPEGFYQFISNKCQLSQPDTGLDKGI